MISKEELYEYLKQNLKESRYIHTLGVASVAKKLAEINNVDVEKAEMAALCHDIAKNKNYTYEDMKKIIDENNIVLSEYEKVSPNIWHSIIAPVEAKRKALVDDEEILEAIRVHTTGKENMSTLDKIIYIADMIEPSRSFDGLEEIRNATLEDLDKGVLMGLNHTIKFLLSKGSIIDINTINARNYLVLQKIK